MPIFQPSDIGPLYDFGLATRDGSLIACSDLKGNSVEVGQMAYVCSTDKSKLMKESTELQEKQNLIQFSSSNLIDREFDQWPQVTQGDWSGGIGQRVFGSNGTTNQYFDGQGLIWPTNDWQPQQPLTGPVISPGGALSNSIGVAGGYLAGAGNGYVYFTLTTTTVGVTFRAGDTAYTGGFATVPIAKTVIAALVAHGYIWFVYADGGGGNILLLQYGVSGAALAQVSSTNLVTDMTALTVPIGFMDGHVIGNKEYVAVAFSYTNATGNQNLVQVLDFSATGAPTSTSITFPFATSIDFTGLVFQGGALNIAVTDGFNASIVSSSPPFSATSTVAVLPGLANAFITAVGSAIFIVGISTFGTTINRMDLFMLSGGTLSTIPPVVTPVPAFSSVSPPVTFGEYALWSITYQVAGQTGATIVLFAYDVVRGRLFRALSVQSSAFVGTVPVVGSGTIAAFGVSSRTISGSATAQAQWGIALWTEMISASVEAAREFYWGVIPQAPNRFTHIWQAASDLISGLIDFTAASNKLYRQVVATFSNDLLEGSAQPSVSLKVWLDQDPARLATTPDFSASVSGLSGASPTQIALPLNRIARKLVYEVSASGGGVINAKWYDNPKLVSVAIQVATGWVWDLFANLNPTARTNAANIQEYAYQHQGQVGITFDHVVAYNFLKQLWRQKGGQCTLYLPNGESYPALIQSLDFESPKPFAASYRADQVSNYQNMVTIKIREDV